VLDDASAIDDSAEGETVMSKGQRGNKEAKKPKKVPAPVKPPGSAGLASPVTPTALPRTGK
jgi:hypothetical protein